MAGRADVSSGACLATDRAFPREQETSASDSHVGLSEAMEREAGTGGPSVGGDKAPFRSLVGSVLGNLTMRVGRGGRGRVRRPKDRQNPGSWGPVKE